MNEVILVNDADQAIGVMEKLEAHQKGALHRAFSVFVFRKVEGAWELLLQQRHPEKYHCGNLWTNTCCSHPRPHESVQHAAERRLLEEMGLRLPLIYAGQFTYRAEFENGLVEHEIDHVFVGEIGAQSVLIDPEEVFAYRWMSLPGLKLELAEHPEHFTPWFKPALEIALNGIQ